MFGKLSELIAEFTGCTLVVFSIIKHKHYRH